LVLAHIHATHALRHLPEEGITHIHVHFLGRSADIAMLMAARLGCKWSATSHAGDAYAPTEPALLARRLASVAAVACTSRSVQESVDRHAAPRRVRTAVIHGGIDSSAVRFTPERPHTTDTQLVTVARLVATKGHWTNLEAAAWLMDRYPSLRWTVVGDGPLRERLAEHASRLGLRGRFTFAGALAHDATLSLLEQADAFVMPCEEDERGGSDGIPFALMEAMAAGVPVVTSPVGGIRELVQPGETGFLVAPRDPSAVIAAIEHLLDEDESPALERLRTAARTKIEREFDLSRQARVLLELLESHLD
jgi:glycosyltransferase involved in cell wall biosynthesis